MQEGSHEERGIDAGNVQGRVACEDAQVVRRGRIAADRERKERSNECHGVDVVLPDGEPAHAQLGGDGLVVWVGAFFEVGGDRIGDVDEHAAARQNASACRRGFARA